MNYMVLQIKTDPPRSELSTYHHRGAAEDRVETARLDDETCVAWICARMLVRSDGREWYTWSPVQRTEFPETSPGPPSPGAIERMRDEAADAAE